MNSCNKGKVGEREWRDQLREAGFDAKRGQQHAGSPDSPDVICPDLPQFHFEVKRVERGNVLDWMLQAIRDAGTKTPIVAHRRNRGQWLVTMRADDWFALVREALPKDVIMHMPQALAEYQANGMKLDVVATDHCKVTTESWQP